MKINIAIIKIFNVLLCASSDTSILLYWFSGDIIEVVQIGHLKQKFSYLKKRLKYYHSGRLRPFLLAGG